MSFHPCPDNEERAIEARFDHSYSVVYRRLLDECSADPTGVL